MRVEWKTAQGQTLRMKGARLNFLGKDFGSTVLCSESVTEKDCLTFLNNLKIIPAIVQISLAYAIAGQNFQFERQGYLFVDRVDH